MSSGGGWRGSGQLALMGGGRGGEGGGTSTLVTCLGSQGTLCPCSSLMTRVGRPWTLLMLLVGPGPFSLMHSARSNNRHPKATQGVWIRGSGPVPKFHGSATLDSGD